MITPSITTNTVTVNGTTRTVSVQVPGPQGPVGDPVARTIVIAAPEAGDAFTLFRSGPQVTLAEVLGLVSGGSVTYSIRYASDRSAVGTQAVASAVVTSTTTGDSATIVSQPIPADEWVWVDLEAVTGTPAEFVLSVAF